MFQLCEHSNRKITALQVPDALGNLIYIGSDLKTGRQLAVALHMIETGQARKLAQDFQEKRK